MNMLTATSADDSGLRRARSIAVLRAVAEAYGWDPRPSPNPPVTGNILKGRGDVRLGDGCRLEPGLELTRGERLPEPADVDAEIGVGEPCRIRVGRTCGLLRESRRRPIRRQQDHHGDRISRHFLHGLSAKKTQLWMKTVVFCGTLLACIIRALGFYTQFPGSGTSGTWPGRIS